MTDLTITAEREEAVDFTTPFMNLGITILFRKPTQPEPALLAFLSIIHRDHPIKLRAGSCRHVLVVTSLLFCFAFSSSSASPAASLSSRSTPLRLLRVIMGGFMWFSARRQRRVMQATIDLHESLQPGDRVHTTSGMEATITAISEDTVDLEIAPGVVTTWMKLAIRDRILPDEPEFDADEDAEEDRAELKAPAPEDAPTETRAATDS